MQFNLPYVKDLGLKREVMDALPYAVVGGSYDGSLLTGIAGGASLTLLTHVVPTGHQLKILFLRVSTTNVLGALYSIVQTNPATAGLTGTVEAFPVVGNVPPFTAGTTAIRDYPMLEAAGAEVLHGSLRDPVHVLEGTVTFNLLGLQPTAGATNYSIVWWGVQDIAEAHP